MNRKTKLLLILFSFFFSFFIFEPIYANTFVTDKTAHLLNEVTKKHFNGAVAEDFISGFFKSNGFSQINAEVGRTGIDGLFIKRHEEKIINVSIVESKFNSSPLGMTKKDGKQMSQQWILKKIQQKQDSLKHQPVTKNSQKQLKTLAEITNIIQKKQHKSLLFTIKPVIEEYKSLSKLKSPTKKQLQRLGYLSELARKNKLDGKFKTSIHIIDSNGNKIQKNLDRYALANKEIDLAANYKKGSSQWKQKKLLSHSIRKNKRLILENKKLLDFLDKVRKNPSKYNKLIKDQRSLIVNIQKSQPKFGANISKKTLVELEIKTAKKLFKIPSIVMKKGNKSLVFMNAKHFKKASKSNVKMFKNLKYFKVSDVVMLTIENGVITYSILTSGITYKKVSTLLLHNSRQVVDGIFFRSVSVIAPPTGFALAVGGTIIMGYVIDKYIELDNRKYLSMNDLFFDIPNEIKNSITVFNLEEIKKESIFDLNDKHKKSIFDDVNGHSVFDDIQKNNNKAIFY